MFRNKYFPAYSWSLLTQSWQSIEVSLLTHKIIYRRLPKFPLICRGRLVSETFQSLCRASPTLFQIATWTRTRNGRIRDWGWRCDRKKAPDPQYDMVPCIHFYYCLKQRIIFASVQSLSSIHTSLQVPPFIFEGVKWQNLEEPRLFLSLSLSHDLCF